MATQRDILIVEDNPGDVRLMREALRDLHPPVIVDAVGDADQALQSLQNPDARKPLLIFLDFNLPKAGSKDFLKTVKEDENLRKIPVAVLTTSGAEHDVQTAYRLRANCYLCKPVDLDGFLTVIRTTAQFWLHVACTPRRS